MLRRKACPENLNVIIKVKDLQRHVDF